MVAHQRAASSGPSAGVFTMSSLLKLSSVVFAGLVVAIASAGCAVDAAGDEDSDEVSAEEALTVRVQAGSFKLYGQPRVTPNPMCDVYTSLELHNRGGAKAALEEHVGGVCELYVAPQPREYRLRFAGTSCGSKIYKGRKKVGGEWRNLTITDHRTRTCRDLVPAKIIVQENSVTRYSHDAPPAPTASTTWLTISPRQCGTNPWNGAQPAPGEEASYLQGEAGEVDNYFRSKGIALSQLGFAKRTEPFAVCLACQCPRGDTLVVQAKNLADASRLVSEFGFAEGKDALTTSPKQCGTNPWEQGMNSPNEADDLASWASGIGAPLSKVGFLAYTEPRIVCAACQCPRGDTAIAFPKTDAGETKLEYLGW
jgi:hypothetical protein